MKKENLLTLLILGALVLGVLVGQFLLFDPSLSAEALRSRVDPWRIAGELVFIRPLMMLIIPLVFVSVVSGVTSIGNPQRLGIIGGATALYYVGTTLVAVLLGLSLVNLVNPGSGVAIEQLESAGQRTFESDVQGRLTGRPGDVGGSFLSLLYQMIPDNPLRSAVDREVLGVVVFAILIGLALVMSGEPARPAIKLIDGLFHALMKLVTWIIWLAPIGIVCIVASRVGEKGLAALVGPLSKYVLTVIVGLLIHLLVVLPAILAVFGRTNPYRFLWSLRKVIVTAFSTASSNATLPVTIEECQTSGGCSRRAANFVVPLGATVNMNGTALYEAVAVSFLFQLFGIDLSLTQQLIILITATLAAIGAAGIPGAGLVTMAIVINAVNASLTAVGGEGVEPLPLWTIGIILGVDRILDMCRTVLNVMGDAVGARIITRLAPDEPDERERALG
ncbi:MAG TPA: hypothetical protein DEB06_04070 [Phycisphaerales bacterium]|nr:hypothetical protein [Phycisphaerales bacterium]